MDKIEDSVFQSLNIIKQQQKFDKKNDENDDDSPDALLNELSKLNQSKSDSKEFDYVQNKAYFDDTYFKNSKLFKM